MSFILEALKKSEQQRQQKNSAPQEVRQRTLSAASHKTSRWPYGIAVLCLGLAAWVGWWFYDRKEPEQGVSRPMVAAQSGAQPQATGQVSTPPLLVSAKQKQVAIIEPAPVPRNVIAPVVPPVNETLEKDNLSAAQLEPKQTLKAESPQANDARVATVVIEQQKQRDIENSKLKATPVKLPRYLDLSRELRDQMPRLAMSMHYYIADPNRRMVRINNLLLHEGDWISNDLQVVDITPKGATLDFSGKIFELRSASR